MFRYQGAILREFRNKDSFGQHVLQVHITFKCFYDLCFIVFYLVQFVNILDVSARYG